MKSTNGIRRIAWYWFHCIAVSDDTQKELLQCVVKPDFPTHIKVAWWEGLNDAVLFYWDEL